MQRAKRKQPLKFINQMAKITDYNEVHQYALAALNEADYDIVQMVGRDVAAQIVANIYNMNDLTTGYAQDIVGTISVISSPWRICAIFDGKMSYYRESDGVCGYLDIEEDMRSICLCLQTAIERVNARG